MWWEETRRARAFLGSVGGGGGARACACHPTMTGTTDTRNRARRSVTNKKRERKENRSKEEGLGSGGKKVGRITKIKLQHYQFMTCANVSGCGAHLT